MTYRARRLPLILVAVLATATTAACSSPGDVSAVYEQAQVTYREDMVTAQEWNNHVLGIPASGWLAILSVGGLIVSLLLIWTIVLVNDARLDRRRKRHELALRQEETRRLAATRGNCPGCGQDYLHADEMRRLKEVNGDL